MKAFEPKSLEEVRRWKRKVSDEMNRLGIEKYNEKSKRRIDALVRSICKKELTPPVHPKERKLTKV
jgi:hypothetical protein